MNHETLEHWNPFFFLPLYPWHLTQFLAHCDNNDGCQVFGVPALSHLILKPLYKVDFSSLIFWMQKPRLNEENLYGQVRTACKGQNSNTVLSDFKVGILST